MSALLEVQGLGKQFGGLQAVDSLSFSVDEGEILGLIGPNGAGKSTVFNLINGVFSPDSGRVGFRGIDITGKPPQRVARLGLARTHQIVQPFASMSVLENCTVGACFGRENLPLAQARQAAKEAASLVGLQDRLDTPALGAYLYEELRGWLLTSETFANFQLVISGVLLLLIVTFAPGGLMGFFYRRWPRLKRIFE